MSPTAPMSTSTVLAPSRGRAVVSILTPEQVPIHFELASVGARILAFALDGAIILGAILLLVLLATFAGLAEHGETGILSALVNLLFFLLTNFYFILSELRWQGRTVGKRAFGLRVVARDGGPVTGAMVLARNLTRDFEFILPFFILVSGGTLLGISSGWLRAICVLWTAVLLFLPLFNRHRARIGDLVAGTLVVHAPRQPLLPDLVSAGPTAAAGRAPMFTFTQEQLDLYGIHELQVLEQVLRRGPNEHDPELVYVIAEKIKTKIGWDAERWQVEPMAFLHDFYGAQRQRLEHKLLFGNRQERKVR